MLRILAAAITLAAAPAAAQGHDPELAALAERSMAQVEAYVLRGEGESIRAIAHPEFRVVLPVGIVENRGSVAGTAGDVRMTRFDQRLLDVTRVGDTAIALTRVDAEGTVAGNPFPARIVMSHVFARDNGAWRLVHRQMTPISVPDPVFERALAGALRAGEPE